MIAKGSYVAIKSTPQDLGNIGVVEDVDQTSETVLVRFPLLSSQLWYPSEWFIVVSIDPVTGEHRPASHIEAERIASVNADPITQMPLNDALYTLKQTLAQLKAELAELKLNMQAPSLGACIEVDVRSIHVSPTIPPIVTLTLGQAAVYEYCKGHPFMLKVPAEARNTRVLNPRGE